MLFDLPDHDTLYAALLARDSRFDGQAYVCVSSTGVFCRLTCPARKPKSENCAFFQTIKECVEAGYRPCKRCRPLKAEAMGDPAVALLLQKLEEQPELRWSEQRIAALGLDPSTVRRSFKRQFGMTFLELARQRRLAMGVAVLSKGGRVIAAQTEAGFESPSAFRAAVARILGRPPRALRPGGVLRADWIRTPLGDMIGVASRTHLLLLEFIDRKALPAELTKLQAGANEAIGLGRHAPIEQAQEELDAYFSGRAARFATPLHQSGGAFTRAVWEELRRIPVGETRSYAQVARQIGRPAAIRAVARANGANQIALMIPCHRVIGSDGALTGYGGGLWRKQRLLEIETQLKSIETVGPVEDGGP